MDRGLYILKGFRDCNNSPNPSAKMPVRPAAYGKPLGEAYYAIPYKDELSQSFMQKQNL